MKIDSIAGSDHPQVRHGRVGVLLLNLGTPDAPTAAAVRPYLRQFLTDRRVIELPALLWYPILFLFVLTFRPRKTARAYKRIWKDGEDSPLRAITKRQAEKLQDALGDDVVVEFGMRYGNPSTESAMQKLRDAGCSKIVALALYPQYSGSTTASSYDEVFRVLQRMRWQPAIRTVMSYHDDSVYIDALVKSVREHLSGLEWTPEKIVLSFHGVPKRYFLAGDPYHCHCLKTARLVSEQIEDIDVEATFQSRFGPEEWLQPYTEPRLEELAHAGTKKIAVATPGFSADCIETLDEIAIEAKEAYEEAGGEHFTFIPCLNDSEGGMATILSVVRNELKGWVDDDTVAPLQVVPSLAAAAENDVEPAATKQTASGG
ncbi:MAG: ferrochelatase [Myxococcota bacterium]